MDTNENKERPVHHVEQRSENPVPALIADGGKVPVMKDMILVKLDPRGERQHEKGQCL